jgi:hypothetical protein
MAFVTHDVLPLPASVGSIVGRNSAGIEQYVAVKCLLVITSDLSFFSSAASPAPARPGWRCVLWVMAFSALQVARIAHRPPMRARR